MREFEIVNCEELEKLLKEPRMKLAKVETLSVSHLRKIFPGFDKAVEEDALIAVSLLRQLGFKNLGERTLLRVYKDNCIQDDDF